MENSGYDILIDKLDHFIRRYYLNQLIKGSLFFGAGFLILLLLIAALEYFGYFNTQVRFILFYGFIAYNAAILIRFMVIPLLGMARIGRRIGAKEAARLLGTYFKNEIKDKVTNALELKDYLDRSEQQPELILAAIEQKAEATRHIPFNKAINLKSNRRFLPFLIVPLLVAAAITTMAPGFLRDPVGRIIRYETHFEKPAPFSFLTESELYGFKNENLKVVFMAEGSVMPSTAEIQFGNSRYKLEKTDNQRFAHIFRNLQESFSFFIHSEGFTFGPFQLRVIQKPGFSHFTVQVNPPGYTGLSEERLTNMGDITVAEGSLIQWEFNTRGDGRVEFYADEEPLTTEQLAEGIYRVQKRAGASFRYQVYASNNETGRGDSLNYFVQVRPDQYPRLQAESMQDSVLLAHLFHQGIIQDDYGFDRMEFAYRIIRGADDTGRENALFDREEILIESNRLNQTVYHHFDVRRLSLKPGEALEYFYEVFDNDGIRGPKSTRSRIFSFYIPGRDELLAKLKQDEERIKEELGGGIGEVQDARDEIEKLRRQMLNSDQFSWEQTESIRDLLSKQQEIEEKIEQLNEFKKDSEIKSDQLKDTNEQIRQKQEEIQKIFEETMSDELKDLFEKIREELEKLDRNQIYDMLSRMEFEFRDLENRMDRALELFKQLEMERMLQESIEMLSELIEEQQDILDETTEGMNADDLAGKQDTLKEEFEMVKDLLEEFREKNEELVRPKGLDDTDELEDAVLENMKEAADQIRKEMPGNAKQKQEGAKQQMEELSMRLQQMQMDMFNEQLAEDARALRQILENLLKTSFNQEELLVEIRSVNINDPRYVDFIQEQRKIKDDLQMIEDSLIALSKRQAQIQSFVSREIGEINMNLERGILHLIERQRGQASSRQQFVMTHINNLALLLNESLQNMQMQMQMAAGSGQGMPQPSPGDPSFQKMREMQEELNESLKKMQDGHQPMPGESGENTMSASEAMARMAAQQEMIRKELERMGQQLKDEGIGDGQDLSDLQKEMEQTELEIVRKEIGRQTIMRQERILTRLLEHERAELQREMEERRVGNTAYNYEISNPEDIFEYNRIRSRELEMLRSMPAGLRPFYKTMVEEYFLNMRE